MQEKVFIALAGAIFGSVVTLFREIWLGHLSRRKKARYASIRIVCLLDRFVDECSEVAYDRGEPDQDGYYRSTTSEPNLDVDSLDVDWESIHHTLLFKVLTLPVQINEANSVISSVWEHVASPPEYDEIFEERQFQYATLGLDALALSKKLRSKYNLPRKSNEMAQRENLANVVGKIEHLRQQRYEANRKLVPPPFDLVPQPKGE